MEDTETTGARAVWITRMRTVVVVLVVGTSACAAIALVFLSLAHSPAWGCAPYFQSGHQKVLSWLLFGANLVAFVAGPLLAVVALFTWWRIRHRSESTTPWPERRRLDVLRTWAGRAALLGLVPPLALLVIAAFPEMVAHCGG